MKRNTKNMWIPVLVSCLAVVIVLGAFGKLLPSLDMPLKPDSSGGGTQDTPVCEHASMANIALHDGDTVDTATFACASCGEQIDLVRKTRFADNLPVRYSEADFDGNTTHTPFYTGNWSVGYYEGISYTPFNAFDAGGNWLCENGGYQRNLFRLLLNDNNAAYWDILAFGLHWDAAGDDNPVAITYEAPHSGTVALSASTLRFSNTAEQYEFNVLLNGNPVLNDWLLIASDENGGINTKEALNEALASKGLSSLHVNRGDVISFAARACGVSVSQSAVLPVVEYTDYDFTVLRCDGSCLYDTDGICEICGRDIYGAIQKK